MPAATKKTSSVKKAPVKKSTVKNKATATVAKSKPAAKKTTTKALRSFRPSAPTEPFFTFRITRQTIYWLILSVIIVGLAAWVIQLSVQVQAIYDQIDRNELLLQDLTEKKTPSTK